MLSELAPLPSGEFMANDEQSYKLWTRALSRVIQAFEDIDNDPTVESTMRCGGEGVHNMTIVYSHVWCP